VQAKRDTESSKMLMVPRFRGDGVWIPAFAGMTILLAHSPIMTLPQKGQGIFSRFSFRYFYKRFYAKMLFTILATSEITF
jgi:hypothetical protein